MVSKGKPVPQAGPVTEGSAQGSKLGWSRQPQDFGRAVGEEMLSFFGGSRLVAISLGLLAKNETNTEANHDKG